MPTYLRKRLSGVALWLVAALCLAGFAATARAQTIWFSPAHRADDAADYMAMFRPDAPWQRAASHAAVFEIGGRWASLGPEAELSQLFADLKRRRIGLDVGFEPLTAPGHGPTVCGYHVEGYGGPRDGVLKFTQRLKSLGADPEYFGFDEPLYFGHVFGPRDGKNGCHSSISELAQDVANKVRQVHMVFPGVPFGDVEPLTFRPGDPWYQNNAWLRDLSDWIDAYQAAVGDRLAFLRIDMWWNTPWEQHMPALMAMLKRKGVPLQVIYNGSGQDRTDEAWVNDAIESFKRFESGPWPKPATGVIQFWTPHPSRILPETEPYTATWLIDRYVAWQQTRK